MSIASLKHALRRRKELVAFLCALILCSLVVLFSVTGWLREERWGAPIVLGQDGPADAVPRIAPPGIAALWKKGGVNPFGGGAALETGGTARISPPPLPPLEPEMPPAPLPSPLDLILEGGP